MCPSVRDPANHCPFFPTQRPSARTPPTWMMPLAPPHFAGPLVRLCAPKRTFTRTNIPTWDLVLYAPLSPTGLLLARRTLCRPWLFVLFFLWSPLFPPNRCDHVIPFPPLLRLPPLCTTSCPSIRTLLDYDTCPLGLHLLFSSCNFDTLLPREDLVLLNSSGALEILAWRLVPEIGVPSLGSQKAPHRIPRGLSCPLIKESRPYPSNSVCVPAFKCT